MKEKDYTSYLAKQLLEDDFFIESCFNPTMESRAYWNELTNKNEIFAKEYVCASTKLRSIPYRERKFSKDDEELLWKRISGTRYRKRLHRYWYSSAAAVVAFLVVMSGIYYADRNDQNELTDIERVQKPENKEETIQLFLAEEKKVAIEEDSRVQYNKEGELHINTQKMDDFKSTNTDSVKKKDLVYNQLLVPAAKRSFLELADGTRIWVNANTRVVYPVTFEEKKREIYVEGEIYIEVYPDENRPFIVKSKKMDIRVLGTKFNVSTNELIPEASVVLVSGKVNVRTDNRVESELEPKDRLIYKESSVDIQKVNVDNYISWKDGFYTFDNECFSTVLNRLSNYYGKKMTYSEEVGALHCSGSLNLGEDMVKILTGLESTMPVSFTIQGEHISVLLNLKKK